MVAEKTEDDSVEWRAGAAVVCIEIDLELMRS